MDTTSRIEGMRRRRDRTPGSAYTLPTISPRTFRIIDSGSMPIAVQIPESKPSPMTNCQIYVLDLFAMVEFRLFLHRRVDTSDMSFFSEGVRKALLFA
jgi:hypothetical protein